MYGVIVLVDVVDLFHHGNALRRIERAEGTRKTRIDIYPASENEADIMMMLEMHQQRGYEREHMFLMLSDDLLDALVRELVVEWRKRHD